MAMYQNMNSQQFAEKVAEIDKSIPDLTDQQIVFQFMELIALLGNGHNRNNLAAKFSFCLHEFQFRASNSNKRKFLKDTG